MSEWAGKLVDTLLQGVDIVLVIAVIVIVWAARKILLHFKVTLADFVWRIIVLALGIPCAFLVASYPLRVGPLLRDMVAYAGAATLAYQLGKGALKLGKKQNVKVLPGP